MAKYSMRKIVRASYDQALALVAEALKAEGFGVLTEIDVKKTLKEKLDVDFRRYKILGACHPPSAYEALRAETDIGLMMPCNLIVYEGDDGKTVVAAVDPLATIATIGSPNLEEIAKGVRARLVRALERIS